ncbi:MAG: hypothetical protein LBD59_09110 [Prevotellaceae bacterium]|jgi:hypothetical protein|nr:hypothetical protein [Prevotellaceae bacterium]
MAGKIIAQKLHKIENALLGVSNHPEIQAMLSAFGYTPERMNEGKILLNRAMSLVSSQTDNYGGQYEAHSEFEKKYESAYSAYMITLKVARVAFISHTAMLTRMCANKDRSRSLSGWLREARVMYDNLLAHHEALEAMAVFGYTAERLDAERAMVNEVESLYSKTLKHKGHAQQTTLERDAAIDELCKWFGAFRSIARIALYEKPQLIEALGIIKH